MILAALDNAKLVAWLSFAIGALVLGAGVYIGLWTSMQKPKKEAKDTLQEANARLDDTKSKLADTKTNLEAVSTASSSGLEGVGAAADVATATEAASSKADEAASSAEAAKTALTQVGDLVGSLPENLRFAGLLVLIGAVLMSVATIQFGGTSLF